MRSQNEPPSTERERGKRKHMKERHGAREGKRRRERTRENDRETTREQENGNRTKNLAGNGYERGKEKKAKNILFLLRFLFLVSFFFFLSRPIAPLHRHGSSKEREKVYVDDMPRVGVFVVADL